MTPRERSKKTLAKFKQAAFDPDAMQLIEDAFTLTIEAVIAERQEACAKIADAIADSFLHKNPAIMAARQGQHDTAREIADAIRKQGPS